jgi:hypothetical protein
MVHWKTINIVLLVVTLMVGGRWVTISKVDSAMVDSAGIGSTGITKTKPTSDAKPLFAGNVAVREVTRSHINAGGHFKISHQVPDVLQVGEDVKVVLQFRLEPFQNVEVTIKTTEDYQLISDIPAVLEGTETGLIELDVYVLPVKSGKFYLKLLVASIDGEKFGSYAVPLRVANELGDVPNHHNQKQHRINLPSGHVR